LPGDGIFTEEQIVSIINEQLKKAEDSWREPT
jgi:hypothetical protein